MQMSLLACILAALLLGASALSFPIVPRSSKIASRFSAGSGSVLPPIDVNNNNGGWGNWGEGEGDGDGANFDLKHVVHAGVFASLWESYNDVLAERPILTKACTSFVGFSVGDIIAQKFIGGEPFDVKRLLRLASFGFLIHGTVSHFFYSYLDAKFPKTDAITVATKVFIDQVLWNPIFGTLFFSYIGLTSGDSPATIVETLKAKLFTAVTASWKVWPIAHAINFRFIPSEQRLLYINSIQICYNVFLSVIATSKK